MIIVIKQKLTSKEYEIIDQEIQKFPNPVYISPRHWKTIDEIYVVKIKGNIAGICGKTKLGNWIKLGPLVVFEKYQGQGIGKQLLKKAVSEDKSEHLFIGSRNPAVAKIVTSLGFTEEKNIWRLPLSFKLYLFSSLQWVIDTKYIQELFRKNSSSEGVFRCFLKRSTSQSP